MRIQYRMASTDQNSKRLPYVVGGACLVGIAGYYFYNNVPPINSYSNILKPTTPQSINEKDKQHHETSNEPIKSSNHCILTTTPQKCDCIDNEALKAQVIKLHDEKNKIDNEHKITTNKYEEQQCKLQEKEERIQSLEQQMSEFVKPLKCRVNQISKQLKNEQLLHQNEITEKNKSIKLIQEKLKEKNERIESLENEISQIDQPCNQMFEQFACLQSEIISLNEVTANKITSLNDEISHLQNDINQQRRKYNTEKSVYQSLHKDEINTLQSQISNLKHKIITQQQQHNNHVEELNAQIMKKGKEKDKMENEYDVVTNKLQEKDEECQVLQEKMSQLITSSESRIAEICKQLSEEQSLHENRIMEKDVTIKSLKNTIDELQNGKNKTTESLKDEICNLQKQINQQQQNWEKNQMEMQTLHRIEIKEKQKVINSLRAQIFSLSCDDVVDLRNDKERQKWDKARAEMQLLHERKIAEKDDLIQDLNSKIEALHEQISHGINTMNTALMNNDGIVNNGYKEKIFDLQHEKEILNEENTELKKENERLESQIDSYKVNGSSFRSRHGSFDSTSSTSSIHSSSNYSIGEFVNESPPSNQELLSYNSNNS